MHWMGSDAAEPAGAVRHRRAEHGRSRELGSSKSINSGDDFAATLKAILQYDDNIHSVDSECSRRR